jgi:hypothetical protein
MYLFSRLRNLLLLLHICFQTLTEKKTLQKKLLPPLSRPRSVRGAQAHRRRGHNKLITGTMNEEKPQQESKRLFFEKKSAKERV